ncbi:siderophore synthetase component [Actinopolyspora biskrensis]|uniref:Siderophore synthetase component n=1 Tax=Actinopolyspora biskrensis TaxID=1470178 RepID=A0A852Z0A7_9ACTN|nr:IucA/IucC family protein [Actinopolyspora biskrensis]NYH79229.1 siderophore synthetase component [Actinopolyspora biskrensis]
MSGSFAVCAGSGTLNSREAAVLAELRRRDAELSRRWSQALPEARAETARGFLGALLREDAPGVRGHATAFRWPPRPDGAHGFPAALLERFADGAGTLVVVRAPGCRAVAALREEEAGFGLGRVSTPVLVERDGGVLALERAERLIDVLRDNDPSAHWERMREELVDSACNLALSGVLVERARKRLLPSGARPDGMNPLSALAAGRPGRDVALELDTLTGEGHSTHPCGKVRLGFSAADSLAYAPESGAYVEIGLVAVSRSLVRSTEDAGRRSVGDLLGAHFPRLLACAVRELRELGRDPDDYALVPVHPWQRRNVLAREYAGELRSGELVPLRGARLPCRPTLSIRTLVTAFPGRRGRRLTIKTSLDVLLTSTRRTISPETTRDAPGTSALLRELLDRDPVSAGKVGTVSDLAGIAFAPPEGGASGSARLRGLSALLREDPADQLNDAGEHLVPASALRAPSPVSDGTLLADLVDELAARTATSGVAAGERFLRSYSELLFSATLPLLSRHGMALEAHMQNTLLVVRGGEPVRLLLRDFAGMRVHRGRMRAAGWNSAARHARATVVEHVEQLHAKLAHSVLQVNLAEVVRSLGEFPGAAQRGAWDVVRSVLVETAERVAATGGGEEARSDLAALLAPTLPQKALATMRLRSATEDVHRPQPNPLHRSGAVSGRTGT